MAEYRQFGGTNRNPENFLFQARGFDGKFVPSEHVNFVGFPLDFGADFHYTSTHLKGAVQWS